MSIKCILTQAAEKITGRKCSSCKYNRGGRCCHPNGAMFMRCWQSITRPGFTGKYEKVEPMPAAPVADLTPEEEYQLQKIKDVLQIAEDDARESGLLTED